MNSWIALLRPAQWTKNFLLLAPLFFAGQVFQKEAWLSLVFGMIAFSLAASSIYILNDYFDAELDRLHPLKRLRPLASGAISPPPAIALAALLLLVSMSIALWIRDSFAMLLAIYALLNLAYSYKLKHIPIVDLTILSSGFILRILAGGWIADVAVSKWILMMTFLSSLFIGLAKRRDDLVQEGIAGKNIRPAMDGYNSEFLQSAMSICASVLIVAYILFTVIDDPSKKIHQENLYLTSVFVILSVLRYLQLCLVEKKSGNPVKVFSSDYFLQLNLLLWLISFAWLLYGNGAN
jgi:decaprenyl-phosphate phosphoribosyltransferase